jgi:hypothetical protein
MTPQQLKAKVLAAWLAQMEKYAKGPVVGEYYCVPSCCVLCNDLGCSGGCPLKLDHGGCGSQKTFLNLYRTIQNFGKYGERLRINQVTRSIIIAMSLRHRFYVRGYNEVLKDAPPERFASGEGFPELLKIDRELMGLG